MIVRISEIEVYPEHLKEYLEFAHNVGTTSVKEEPGVIYIYPIQQLRNDCQIRILETKPHRKPISITSRCSFSKRTSKERSTW